MKDETKLCYLILPIMLPIVVVLRLFWAACAGIIWMLKKLYIFTYDEYPE